MTQIVSLPVANTFPSLVVLRSIHSNR
uniref:Uncharacterized protein n=1 Tax=Amphimedon queenslandica TaxID=400682 RepID=A0A1X7V0S1_AMPQE